MSAPVLPPRTATPPELAHELTQPLGAIASYAEACRLLLGRPGNEARVAATLATIVAQTVAAGQALHALQRALPAGGTPAPWADADADAPTLAARLAAIGLALAPPAETEAETAAAGDWRPAAAVAAALAAELPALAARLSAVAAQPCCITATLSHAGCVLRLAPAQPVAASLAAQGGLLDAATADCAQRLLGCGISLSPHWLPGRGLAFELRLPGAPAA